MVWRWPRGHPDLHGFMAPLSHKTLSPSLRTLRTQGSQRLERPRGRIICLAGRRKRALGGLPCAQVCHPISVLLSSHRPNPHICGLFMLRSAHFPCFAGSEPDRGPQRLGRPPGASPAHANVTF